MAELPKIRKGLTDQQIEAARRRILEWGSKFFTPEEQEELIKATEKINEYQKNDCGIIESGGDFNDDEA